MAKKSFVKLYIWILRSTGSVPYPEKQWGRKDAFPGADGSTITQTTGGSNAETITLYGASGNTLTEGSVMGLRKVNITTDDVIDEDNTTLTYAIKNPLSFIYNSIEPRDWYTDNEMNQNSTLWANDTKTHYDPCPKGWKVPQDGTWNDISSTTLTFYMQGAPFINTSLQYHLTNGQLYKQVTWYPASGYRTANTGNLTFPGCTGNHYSSTAKGVNSILLNLTLTGTIRPNFDNSRTYANPVRCVQE